MKYSTITANGVHFLCMVLAVIIYVRNVLWFASAFILLKPFYFIWFSYGKMRLVILYASCFSYREQSTLKKSYFLYYKCL